LVDLEGFEPSTSIDMTQVIDPTKREKRYKRVKRQFEVHARYMGLRFFQLVDC